jgi:uncharacterized protein (TIGR00730 family)
MTEKKERKPRYRAVKAYANEAFLESRDARALRILSEYLEPATRFERLGVKDTIVFFGSARIGSPEQAAAEVAAAEAGEGDLERARTKVKLARYYEATRELAYRLTQWSKGLEGAEHKDGTEGRRFVVCSGGGPGIMEAASRGASEAKGANVGLGISLQGIEPANPYVTRSLAFEFHYFFMRKLWFLYLAKAVVVMPGGFGTMDELFEVVTLIQTFKIRKRLPIVLFGTDFWGEVVNFEALVRYGTISAEDLKLMHATDSVDDAYAYIVRELTSHAIGNPGPSL